MQEIDKSYREDLHVVVEDHVPQDVIEANNKKKLWAYGYNHEYDMVIVSKDGTIGQVISIETLNTFRRFSKYRAKMATLRGSR